MPFAHFDADNVGAVIELLLLDGNIKSATIFSVSVTDAMERLTATMKKTPGVEVKLKGGDDLILEMTHHAVATVDFEGLRREFESATGTTISAGVGETVQDALENLRRAKLGGRNRVVSRLGPQL